MPTQAKKTTVNKNTSWSVQDWHNISPHGINSTAVPPNEWT